MSTRQTWNKENTTIESELGATFPPPLSPLLRLYIAINLLHFLKMKIIVTQTDSGLRIMFPGRCFLDKKQQQSIQTPDAIKATRTATTTRLWQHQAIAIATATNTLFQTDCGNNGCFSPHFDGPYFVSIDCVICSIYFIRVEQKVYFEC